MTGAGKSVAVTLGSRSKVAISRSAQRNVDIGRPSISGGRVPPGGLPGQVLAKNTEIDFDTYWVDIAYRHYQTDSANIWTVNHNLGFQPNVLVVDSTGRQIMPGDVEYLDNNTVQLHFSATVGGECYCS